MRRMSFSHMSKTHENRRQRESHSELAGQQRPTRRILTPFAEWVKMGKNGYLLRSGAKWL